MPESTVRKNLLKRGKQMKERQKDIIDRGVENRNNMIKRGVERRRKALNRILGRQKDNQTTDSNNP